MNMRILHLEDDTALLEILRLTVAVIAPEMDMQQFVSSDRALEYVRQEANIDLCIVDIRVPGELDGLEFAQALRELGFQGIIVVTSAFGKPKLEILEALDIHWVAKPWDFNHDPNSVLSFIRHSAKGRV